MRGVSGRLGPPEQIAPYGQVWGLGRFSKYCFAELNDAREIEAREAYCSEPVPGEIGNWRFSLFLLVFCPVVPNGNAIHCTLYVFWISHLPALNNLWRECLSYNAIR